MTARKIALLMGRDCRFLDHLAPLCFALDMPLLITEEDNYELAQTYYPMVCSYYEDYTSLSYEKLATNYDMFFQSNFWQESLIGDFLDLQKKRASFIWAPHGNSDKGHKAPMLEPLICQDGFLLYGDHMLERLKLQGLLDKSPPFVRCGNYRALFYELHKESLDRFVEERVFSKIPPNKKTILYAPTWNDEEESTSFFDYTETLIDELSDGYNLIIKPHPLLEEHEPAYYYSLLKNSDKPNVLLLENFPLIYPLLNKVDLYLGDRSSIGYDALYFDIPLLFIDSFNNRPTPLQKVGHTILPGDKRIYQSIDQRLQRGDSFTNEKKELYKHTFGEQIAFERLRDDVEMLHEKIVNEQPSVKQRPHSALAALQRGEPQDRKQIHHL